MKYFLVVSILVLSLFGISQARTPPIEFKNGDLIFQTSTSNQGSAIMYATHSKYTHVGIIYKIGNSFHVYEAIKTVQFTPLEKYIERGKGKHYVVKRLKEVDKILGGEALLGMKKVGETLKGKNYDYYFRWSDDRIYCSELVWKIYQRGAGVEIGKLQRLKEFDLDHPIVKNKIKERYGENVPLDELVISPASMFISDKLIKVVEN